MPRKTLYIQPTKAAITAAKKGLEARKKAPKSKKGGLDTQQAKAEGVGSGVARARDIIAGKRVNAYQVKAFFARHRQNYLDAKIKGLRAEESRAIQAWLIWGGEPLRKQAEQEVAKHEKAKVKMSRKDNPYSRQESVVRPIARKMFADLKVAIEQGYPAGIMPKGWVRLPSPPHSKDIAWKKSYGPFPVKNKLIDFSLVVYDLRTTKKRKGSQLIPTGASFFLAGNAIEVHYQRLNREQVQPLDRYYTVMQASLRHEIEHATQDLSDTAKKREVLHKEKEETAPLVGLRHRFFLNHASIEEVEATVTGLYTKAKKTKSNFWNLLEGHILNTYSRYHQVISIREYDAWQDALEAYALKRYPTLKARMRYDQVKTTANPPKKAKRKMTRKKNPLKEGDKIRGWTIWDWGPEENTAILGRSHGPHELELIVDGDDREVALQLIDPKTEELISDGSITDDLSPLGRARSMDDATRLEEYVHEAIAWFEHHAKEGTLDSPPLQLLKTRVRGSKRILNPKKAKKAKKAKKKMARKKNPRDGWTLVPTTPRGQEREHARLTKGKSELRIFPYRDQPKEYYTTGNAVNLRYQLDSKPPIPVLMRIAEDDGPVRLEVKPQRWFREEFERPGSATITDEDIDKAIDWAKNQIKKWTYDAGKDLAEINKYRARIGQRPLDPKAAGWTPVDILKEAQRIRSNPPRKAKKKTARKKNPKESKIGGWRITKMSSSEATLSTNKNGIKADLEIYINKTNWAKTGEIEVSLHLLTSQPIEASVDHPSFRIKTQKDNFNDQNWDDAIRAGVDWAEGSIRRLQHAISTGELKANPPKMLTPENVRRILAGKRPLRLRRLLETESARRTRLQPTPDVTPPKSKRLKKLTPEERMRLPEMKAQASKLEALIRRAIEHVHSIPSGKSDPWIGRSDGTISRSAVARQVEYEFIEPGGAEPKELFYDLPMKERLKLLDRSIQEYKRAHGIKNPPKKAKKKMARKNPQHAPQRERNGRANLRKGANVDGWIVEYWAWGPPSHKNGPNAILHSDGIWELLVQDSTAYLRPSSDRYLKPTQEWAEGWQEYAVSGDLMSQARKGIAWANTKIRSLPPPKNPRKKAKKNPRRITRGTTIHRPGKLRVVSPHGGTDHRGTMAWIVTEATPSKTCLERGAQELFDDIAVFKLCIRGNKASLTIDFLHGENQRSFHTKKKDMPAARAALSARVDAAILWAEAIEKGLIQLRAGINPRKKAKKKVSRKKNPELKDGDLITWESTFQYKPTIKKEIRNLIVTGERRDRYGTKFVRVYDPRYGNRDFVRGSMLDDVLADNGKLTIYKPDPNEFYTPAWMEVANDVFGKDLTPRSVTILATRPPRYKAGNTTIKSNPRKKAKKKMARKKNPLKKGDKIGPWEVEIWHPDGAVLRQRLPKQGPAHDQLFGPYPVYATFSVEEDYANIIIEFGPDGDTTFGPPEHFEFPKSLKAKSLLDKVKYAIEEKKKRDRKMDKLRRSMGKRHALTKGELAEYGHLYGFPPRKLKDDERNPGRGVFSGELGGTLVEIASEGEGPFPEPHISILKKNRLISGTRSDFKITKRGLKVLHETYPEMVEIAEEERMGALRTRGKSRVERLGFEEGVRPVPPPPKNPPKKAKKKAKKKVSRNNPNGPPRLTEKQRIEYMNRWLDNVMKDVSGWPHLGASGDKLTRANIARRIQTSYDSGAQRLSGHYDAYEYFQKLSLKERLKWIDKEIARFKAKNFSAKSPPLLGEGVPDYRLRSEGLINPPKKAKKKAPTAKELVSKCQKLWAAYCKKPGVTKLRAVDKHCEAMKVSKAKAVKTERTRCMKSVRAEAKARGWKI